MMSQIDFTVLNIKKMLIPLAGGGLALAGLAALSFFAGHELQTHSALTSTVTGFHQGDFIRVEAIADDDYVLHYEETADQISDLTFENTQDVYDKDHYLILVSVQPDISEDPTEISFVVNKSSGLIQARASGLQEASKSSLSINGKAIEKDVRADWGGQTSLKGVVYNTKSGTANVCMDIGGYRGGSLSVCHTLENNNIVHAQFNGGADDGPGIPPFHYEFQEFWVNALMRMTEQLTVTMMMQASMFGQFLDAKHQLETQRMQQMHQAEVQSKFHPSEQMCSMGTVTRHLTQSESEMKVARQGFEKLIRDRDLATGRNMTFKGQQSDKLTRIERYKQYHCNVLDNGTGLEQICGGSGAPGDINADINVYHTLYAPKTIEIDMRDPAVSPQERNMYSLMDNLFLPQANPYIPPTVANSERITSSIQDLHANSAKRSFLRSTFIEAIAPKISGPEFENDATPYIRAYYQDMGLPDDEITELIGERPSYTAQMDTVRGWMKQPDFISTLQSDSPANAERTKTGMMAGALLQDMDTTDMKSRNQANLSMLVEAAIVEEEHRSEGLIGNATEGFDN